MDGDAAGADGAACADAGGGVAVAGGARVVGGAAGAATDENTTPIAARADLMAALPPTGRTWPRPGLY